MSGFDPSRIALTLRTLGAGSKRAILAMSRDWQFPGKATFDANGAHMAWCYAHGGVERELQRLRADKPGKRAAYRLTDYGAELQGILRDSGRLPEGEDAPAAECVASQSGAATDSASPEDQDHDQ